MTLQIWMHAAINGSEWICHEAQTPNCVKINLFPVELRRDAQKQRGEDGQSLQRGLSKCCRVTAERHFRFWPFPHVFYCTPHNSFTLLGHSTPRSSEETLVFLDCSKWGRWGGVKTAVELCLLWRVELSASCVENKRELVLLPLLSEFFLLYIHMWSFLIL